MPDSALVPGRADCAMHDFADWTKLSRAELGLVVSKFGDLEIGNDLTIAALRRSSSNDRSEGFGEDYCSFAK